MTEYANLDRYLQGAVVAERVRWAKHPDEWVGTLALLVVIVVTGGKGSWWWFVAVIGGWALSWLLLGLRLKSWSRKAIMADGLRKRLPSIVRRELRKGLLVGKIGDRAASILESSAVHTLGPLQAAAEAIMLGDGGLAYREAQTKAGNTADDLMRRQLAAVQGALAFPGGLLQTDFDALQAREHQLRGLAAASEVARNLVRNRDDPDALRETLDHLRAFQAAHEEMEAGDD